MYVLYSSKNAKNKVVKISKCSFFSQKSNGHYSVPVEPPPDYNNTDLPYIPPPDYTPPSQHKGMANGKAPQMHGKAHIANGRITPVSS